MINAGEPERELLERVYQADVLKCERRGGRMTFLAFLTERRVVRDILRPPRPALHGAARRARAVLRACGQSPPGRATSRLTKLPPLPEVRRGALP